MEDNIVFYIIIGIAGVLGAVLTVKMIIGIIFILKLKSYGILTEAKVIDTYTSYYRFPYRNPTIEYEANGKIFKIERNEQGLFRPWRIGDTLKIKYDPKNEEKCYILVNSILYYITGLLVSLLFATVSIGLFISALLVTLFH